MAVPAGHPGSIMIKIAICGYGYWGTNLLRVFFQNRNFEVVAVAERRPGPCENLKRHYPGITIYDDALAAIDHPGVDAVVIATPVASHYALAKYAIDRGKHVLVEKPICSSSDEAAYLVAAAERANVILMVDHTFVFHPVVRKLSEMARAGGLGHVSYYDSLRINLGLFQPDVNVLWDLAPHDLSIIDHLFGEEPVYVEATGYCHLNPDIPDIAYVTMHFPSRMVAHLNLSWMSPVKARRIAVGGTAKMAVWDDLDREEPLRLYDSGISVRAQEERDVVIPGYRIGDVYAPRMTGSEPLAAVAEHFHNVITGKEKSIMDGRKGMNIVRILEAAQRTLDGSLKTVNAHYTTGTLHGRDPNLRAAKA
jgi:predicted dehydrogenase